LTDSNEAAGSFSLTANQRTGKNRNHRSPRPRHKPGGSLGPGKAAVHEILHSTP
jgi:hypothetical protein